MLRYLQLSRFSFAATGWFYVMTAIMPEATHAGETAGDVIPCRVPASDRTPSFENIAGQVVETDQALAFLRQRMRETDTPALSVAVVAHGEVVFSATIGLADKGRAVKVTPCTIFEGASITKPLFAFLVMTFVEEGALDLDRPLSEYLALPELKHDPRHRLLTARMVLTHQTGLPNWRQDLPDGRLRFLFDPGTSYGYSGEAFQYLALVIQHIAGVDARGLERIFEQRVAVPLGMSGTAIVPDETLLKHKATGYHRGQVAPIWIYGDDFGAAYGVNTRAQDFALWLAALVRREGLSRESYEALLAPQEVRPSDDEEAAQSVFGEREMTLGFFSYDVPGVGRIFTHDGNNEGFSSLFIIHPESRWGIVMLANQDRATETMLEFAMFINRIPEP